MPRGVPLTEEKQEQRRKEIFAASVHLFLEKGFNETSMREIAEAAGVGTSTLYDYFKSKDEILVSYYENEIQKITNWGQEIVTQDLSVSEKLRTIMQKHLAYLLDNKSFHLKLFVETQRLSMGSQQLIQAQRYKYREMLRALIEEGMQTGEFREVNAQLAARSIYTLLTIAVFTAPPTATSEEIMEDAMEIYFNGIRA